LSQGLPGLIQMLSRFSTSLALLLAMLGMFWLGDACCDNQMGEDPVSTIEFLRSSIDSADRQDHAPTILETVIDPRINASAQPIGMLVFDVAACIRLRSQQNSVRGPPRISA
jgi:hypothetical protein